MATRRSKQNASEEKSKMPKALSTKLCHIQGNNKIKFCEKIGIEAHISAIEALLMYIMNNNTPRVDAIKT